VTPAVAAANRTGARRLPVALVFGLALGASVPAAAQSPAPAPSAAVPATASGMAGTDVLKGTWVRPDGGYMIVIKSIAANGQLDASYFNPKPLPFAKAQASREGMTLRAFFELQAGGYAGSTYELTYDPSSDRLKGIYFQAVVKQKFDVYFVRK